MVALLTVHRLCVPPTHVVKNCAYWKLPVFQNFLYMEELHIKKKIHAPYFSHFLPLSIAINQLQFGLNGSTSLRPSDYNIQKSSFWAMQKFLCPQESAVNFCSIEYQTDLCVWRAIPNHRIWHQGQREGELKILAALQKSFKISSLTGDYRQRPLQLRSSDVSFHGKVVQHF